MKNLKTVASFFAAFLMVLGLSAPGFSQSLEERVRNIEEQMQDDESPADKYVSEFGGRIMADFTFNTDQGSNLRNSIGLAEDGFEFRRARLYAEGPIGQAIDYKFQLDFAGDAVELKDAYISYANLPYIDNLKVGQFKEPFSINEQTSSKYITFMSRSALTDGLSQARRPGFQTSWHSENKKYNLKVGTFNIQDGQQPATDGSWDLAGRLTSPVIYEDNGRRVVHLGIAGRESAEQSGSVDIDLEPEVHKGDPEYLEVSIPARSSTTFGLEAATVHGPMSFQAEWAQQGINTPGGTSDVDLDSWYLMGSYFLTGEHRPYDPADGDFGRIDVNDEWSGMSPSQSGAWEVAARWSNTDFSEAQGVSTIASIDRNDGTTAGPPFQADIDGDGDEDQADADLMASEMDVLTLGLNWYPHEHAKWMLNYVDAEQDALNGDGQWITSRFQVDF